MENECYLINVKKLTAETKKKATARTTTTYNLEKNRKEIPAWYRRIGNRTQRIGLSHTHNANALHKMGRLFKTFKRKYNKKWENVE